MSSVILEQLETYGPDACPTVSVEEARAWCARLTRGHYENFSVLSSLVPRRLREDFAAVYGFCRCADDLGDETGDPERSIDLLGWWREELDACYRGAPRHPVFVALAPTIERHDLPREPFEALIGAFEQDQRVTRYETWDELIGYCRGSADPVGRLVLMICGEPRSPELYDRADEICTALQLTNHWQDIARDILERDRIYLPRELNPIENFDDRLRRSAAQGYGVDQAYLGEARKVVKACCDRTWPLFESGQRLVDLVGPTTRPIVWLLAAGGQHVLRLVESWNYETVLHRPSLGPVPRVLLVGRAWLMALRARGASS